MARNTLGLIAALGALGVCASCGTSGSSSEDPDRRTDDIADSDPSPSANDPETTETAPQDTSSIESPDQTAETDTAPSSAASTDSGCEDDDADGWCVELDCNDTDPLSYPGAAETPENGRDDDCDGMTDENTFLDSGAPSDAATKFSGVEDPARAPQIVYPATDVLLPPNVSGIVFQWEGGAGNDLWRVRFDGEGVDGVAYVTGTRFTPDGAFWSTLTQGNLNRSVDITVEGASTLSPGSKGTSAVLHIAFAEESIDGGLYYWAASSVVGADYGIFRYDFGNSLQQAAEPIYTASQAGRCVACHSLSHDGKRMALNYDGGDGIADLIEVESRATLVPAGAPYYANFHAFSPDDQHLLAVYRGQMALRNGADGALIEMAPMQPVTYPDWSSNGVDIVYTRATRTTCGYSDWSFFGGQIEVVQFHGPGNWSEPRVLVPAAPGYNFYYPAFSPDGQWVVFNRAEENAAAGCDPATRALGDTYSDDSAELWVVPLAGGAPIRLDALNALPYQRTSWAKWAPSAQSLGDETIFWLTVSSIRPYVPELPGGGLPQIWMAAFHVDRAEAGLDPSRPGFWLPFQDLSTNNHIPQWTEVFVEVQ